MILSAAQIQTLKTAILAEGDVAFVALRQSGATFAMAEWFNGNSTTVVWRSSVSVRETGQVFNGAEWAGMTSANHTRLQSVAQYLANYNPTGADVRAMFNDIWSGAGGTLTRASLLALWKRFATRAEKLFATGTGTDAVPATLVTEGRMSETSIVLALAN